MKRRVFMGVGAAAAVGAAAFTGLRESDKLPAPARELHALSPYAFGILVCFAERILTFDASRAPDRALVLEVVHGVDANLRFAPPETREDLDLVLRILENGLSGLLTRGSTQLFSELKPPARDAAVRAWLDSRVGLLRGAANALRKLCLGVAYAPLPAAQAVGYPGPPAHLLKPPPPPMAARAPLAVTG